MQISRTSSQLRPKRREIQRSERPGRGAGQKLALRGPPPQPRSQSPEPRSSVPPCVLLEPAGSSCATSEALALQAPGARLSGYHTRGPREECAGRNGSGSSKFPEPPSFLRSSVARKTRVLPLMSAAVIQAMTLATSPPLVATLVEQRSHHATAAANEVALRDFAGDRHLEIRRLVEISDTQGPQLLDWTRVAAALVNMGSGGKASHGHRIKTQPRELTTASCVREACVAEVTPRQPEKPLPEPFGAGLGSVGTGRTRGCVRAALGRALDGADAVLSILVVRKSAGLAARTGPGRPLLGH